MTNPMRFLVGPGLRSLSESASVDPMTTTKKNPGLTPEEATVMGEDERQAILDLIRLSDLTFEDRAALRAAFTQLLDRASEQAAALARVDRSMNRGTGGNRFIDSDAGIPELMRVIHEGLYELAKYDEDRPLDIAAVTITTRRIPSGRISVQVAADLAARAGDGS